MAATAQGRTPAIRSQYTVVAARKMPEMSKRLPERSGYPAKHALRRQLRIACVGQGDRRRQYRSDEDSAPAHGPIRHNPNDGEYITGNQAREFHQPLVRNGRFVSPF